MATSGTFTPDSTFDILTIIEEAYERIGKEVRSGYEIKSARRSLDLITKEWSNKGVNLWTIEEYQESVAADATSFALQTDYIDVIEAVWRTGSGTDQLDRVMTRISVREWAHIANKNTTSPPTEFWIHRTNTPTFNFWPKANAAGTIVYWAMRHLEDAGDYTNTMDIPPRFLPALTAGLAYYLAMKAGDMERIPLLKADYNEQWTFATEEDRERASLKLVPRIS
jgi:hypothetical protein